MEGAEPKSVVFFNPMTGEYKFTKPALHLLSKLSGVSEDRISKVKLLSRSSGSAPYYSIDSKGRRGGAITFYDRILYTENFFTGKYSTLSYGTYEWLDISAHEVGHLPQADEYGHNLLGKLIYMQSFAKEYLATFITTRDFHDKAPRESLADIGTINFYDFIKFTNGKYGIDALTNLFNNTKLSDMQKIGRIDSWFEKWNTSNIQKISPLSATTVGDANTDIPDMITRPEYNPAPSGSETIPIQKDIEGF